MRRVVLACLAVAAASLLLPSTPTYDPWAWLIWGREILTLDLSTQFGPSWKPLPVIFTTVYALLGDLAPALWLVTARAGGLLAFVLVFRLTMRLAGGAGRAGDGAPGLLGGAVAVGSLLSVVLVVSLTVLGHSEGLLVALVLWSIDRHLDGRTDHAVLLGFASALIRPEVWPFLGLYAVYLWLKEPQRRLLVVALLLLVPALWFLPELWGSGDAFRASARAKAPDPGTAILAPNPALESLRDAEALVLFPVQLAALVAVGFGLYRRERSTLMVAGGVIAWVALVVAMTFVGYPGVPRLMLPAAALLCVLAGLAASRLVQMARGGTRSLAVGILILVAGAAVALPRAGNVTNLVTPLRVEAEQNRDLALAIEKVGGRQAVLACGQLTTAPLQVTALAWQLEVPISSVGIDPREADVLFRVRDIGAGAVLPPLPLKPAFQPVVSVGDQDVLTTCKALLSASSEPAG